VSEAGSGPRATAGSSSTPLSRREQMLRYLLNHPEYDEPQTSGELTFFIANHPPPGDRSSWHDSAPIWTSPGDSPMCPRQETLAVAASANRHPR
jgi:hypothetical protein